MLSIQRLFLQNMNKIFNAILTAAVLVGFPLQAATVVKNYDEASKAVGKNGYIVFVYGANWDPTGLQICRKHMDSPAVKEAAGDAVMWTVPFYQLPTDEQKTDQNIKWGSLKLPHGFSAESYPALLLYDTKLDNYAVLNGALVQKGTPEEVAVKLKETLVNKSKRDEVMTKADAAQGVEKAKLLLEACRIPGLNRPERIIETIKSIDPQDQSGAIRTLTYEPSAKAESYSEKSMAEAIADLEKLLQDPVFTPEQRQSMYAIMVGKIHLEGTYDDRAKIMELTQKMRELNPDSLLGRSAVIAGRLWGGQLDYETGWTPLCLPPGGGMVQIVGRVPISSPGRYTVTFVKTGGADLRVLGVEVRKGGNKVGGDEHACVVQTPKKEEVDPKQKGPRRLSSRARSAAKEDDSTNNVYTVSIPKGDNVTLHVRVENGGNCYGRVIIKKK